MVEKVKILIVEDEIVLGLDMAQRLKLFGYEILPVAKNAKQALDLLEKTKPDILILDIKLANSSKDGIDLAHEIRKRYQLPYIFLSSHADEELLKRAKEVQPAAYILKPVNDNEIKIAIEIALSNFSNNQVSAAEKPTLTINDSLFLKKDHHFQRVRFEHILWLKADSNYTEIHTTMNTFVYSMLMKKLEAILPGDRFFRIHRSYIINKESISGFEGNHVLIQQEKIPVSKQFRPMVFRWFNIL